MVELFIFSNRFGRLEFFEIRDIIYIKSIGIITPSLLKLELEKLSEYMKGKIDYTYIVDLRELTFPHPANAYYLSKIYRLPNFKDYFVYSESWIFKAMLKSFRLAVPYTKFLTRSELDNITKNYTTPL